MSVMTSISVDAAIRERLGIAAVTRVAYSGNGFTALISKLLMKLAANPNDPAALMDLSVVEQIKGNLETGLDLQASALQWCQAYKTRAVDRTSSDAPTRLLALAAPIHMGGNTPVEFLLDGSNVELTTLYVSPESPLPDPLPEHDLAIVIAPGDSDFTRPYLDEISRHTQTWTRPVLNNPQSIAKLERDSLVESLRDVQGVLVPETIRVPRSTLEKFAGNGASTTSVARADENKDDLTFVVRPVGAHAGRNLEKISSVEDVASYLIDCPDQEFFCSDYIDYRSADGLFRKYRIVFVDGQAYPCHMAIADQWKVWYMNADMATNEAKRAEEAAFMTGFYDGFAGRHRDAFNAITERIRLDYFGIDCAELPDGRLVIFEADNALIVHDMDAPDIFPYKPPQMRKVFDAFATMIESAVN